MNNDKLQAPQNSQPSERPAAEYERFKKKVFSLTGISLDKYKERQMKRRLTSLMNLHGLQSFDDYAKLMADDKKVLKKFLDRTTINVSEFFRNPEKFKELQDEVIPELAKKFTRLKIWSAGCSIGTEVYTLAIIMEELKIGYSILASDLDDEVLRQAKEGLYGAESLKNVSAHLLKKYFDSEGELYKVKNLLKKNVRFKKQNMLEERFDSGFHLVLCRNVVIYFTEEAKDVLYRKFSDSLVAGGVLFIGNTERVFRAGEMGLNSFSNFFYRKNS